MDRIGRLAFPRAQVPFRKDRYQTATLFSHELSSLECRYISAAQVKPLTILPLQIESIVPVCLDADGIIRPNVKEERKDVRVYRS